MIVRRIALSAFRNYDFETAEFDAGTNVICGKNAQGKTNLLEAVYMLSGGRSFRTRFDKELVGFGSDWADILADVYSHGREQTVNIRMTPGRPKRILVNAVKKTAGELSDTVNTVLFCPDDLNLIKEGASVRRRLMDNARSARATARSSPTSTGSTRTRPASSGTGATSPPCSMRWTSSPTAWRAPRPSSSATAPPFRSGSRRPQRPSTKTSPTALRSWGSRIRRSAPCATPSPPPRRSITTSATIRSATARRSWTAPSASPVRTRTIWRSPSTAIPPAPSPPRGRRARRRCP